MPLPNVGKSADELECLQGWLKSYRAQELFTEDGKPIETITSIIPKEKEKRLGMRAEAYKAYEPLNLPDWKNFAVKSGEESSCMQTISHFLKQVILTNPKTFRIFSPDELESNKLSLLLSPECTTRNFQWDPATRSVGGRIIEILSEHTCQGFLQGYTLTGRTGLFPSYESFLGIISTMMVQYSKFCKIAGETPWREGVGSLNYVETSTWARQEHNGFSHQNPLVVSYSLIALKVDEIQIIHRHSLKPQIRRSEGLPPTRRKLFPQHYRTLPPRKELRESHGGQ